MFIKDLTLKSFRNYSKLVIDFSPELNFITGDNGVGKSNILEAISILSNLKSFRNINDSEIVQWGYDSYYCSSNIVENDSSFFEVGYADRSDGGIKKRAKVDNVEVATAKEYYGKMLSVVFSPVDIDIINGAPERRRRYFDSVISKIDNDYFNEISEFRKILYSRNSHLKKLKETGSNDYSELSVWDDMFAQKASNIVNKRIEFCDEFSRYFEEAYLSIARHDDSPFLKYKPSLNYHDISDVISKLKSNWKRDIITGSTGSGPQRDDFKLENEEGNDFNNYASQGQKRTSAISFKISESVYIEKNTGNKCIILVDDIFSELDETRRNNMIDFIKKGNQVIFTMVHSGYVDMSSFNNSRHFKIDPAGIVREI